MHKAAWPAWSIFERSEKASVFAAGPFEAPHEAVRVEYFRLPGCGSENVQRPRPYSRTPDRKVVGFDRA